MTEKERREKQAEVMFFFKPSAPINEQNLFSGRREQIDDVFNAIIQDGQHVIIFGERGVGKTSFARVISEIVSGIVQYKLLDSGTINCDSTDTFASLWHKVFKELTMAIETSKMGFGDDPPESVNVNLDRLLPEMVTPDDVRYALHKYISQKSIIIIDEFDRITDQECKRLLADTIKNLSDHAVNSTILLVGVGDSVEDLFAGHKSIERCLIQVPMPRMTIEELEQILDKALTSSNMKIDLDVKKNIARMSHGLPHFTHLLGQHSALQAIKDNRLSITKDDLWSAIEAIIRKPHHLQSAYHKAVSSSQTGNLYAKVLLACALTKTDDLGYFSAADVAKPLSEIMGKPYPQPNYAKHIAEFCKEERGPVLHRTGSSHKYRYRFADPMLQPYTMFHGYADGALPKA